MSACAVATSATPVETQPLTTLRWQLQPFCNVLTLQAAALGSVYTLDGFDDQCGQAPRGSVVGTAFPDPDGSIGLGLTIVVAPEGRPVHLDARLEAGSATGSWRDSAGNAGTFAFTPGAATGGTPRPAPPEGVTGVVTGAQIVPGAVGRSQIDTTQVQARVVGTCPVGQYLRGIRADGAVECEPLFTLGVNTSLGIGAAHDLGGTAMIIGRDGLPIVAHMSDQYALRVTSCGNTACSTGNRTVSADTEVNGAVDIAMVLAPDGLPVISRRVLNGNWLRITKCGNAHCSAGNVSTTAATGGIHSSIAIAADGLPIISHQHNGTLRVTKCVNVFCTGASVTTTVDAPGEGVGRYSSIAIGADGLPVIAHRPEAGRAVRVTRCLDANCVTSSSRTLAETATDGVIGSVSLAIGTDGLPSIAYDTDGLHLVKCGDAGCTAGNITAVVDARSAAWPSIAIGRDGRPIIAYSAGGLRVTWCGTPSCATANISTQVDQDDTVVGFAPSIAIGNDGLPIVSHLRLYSNELRVSKCGSRTCQ